MVQIHMGHNITVRQKSDTESDWHGIQHRGRIVVGLSGRDTHGTQHHSETVVRH